MARVLAVARTSDRRRRRAPSRLVRHKRMYFHFTPTSASWLNQETSSSILQRQARERDRFGDARALGAPIER